VPAGHDIRAFAFSPDRKTLAGSPGGFVGRADGQDQPWIRLYELATGKEIRQFQREQRGQVHGLAFSADGRTLASASSDKAIHLWEVATGKERQALSADQYSAGTVAFSPDGKTLASANADGLIRIWDVATGKVLGPHEGHQGIVSAVALSADGKTLVSAGSDGTVRTWETLTGKEQRRLEGHQGPIPSVRLSPDGKLLASVCPDDQTVRLWNMATGTEVHRLPVSSHYIQAAWLPDGKKLVVGRHGSLEETTLHFYDTVTGKELRSLEGVGAGAVLAVSADGKLLASGSPSYPTFHLREIATAEKMPPLAADSVHQGPVTSASFSHDAKNLLTASTSDRVIRLWEVATRKERLRFVHEAEVTCLALSPDGRTLASAGYDRTVRLWEVTTGKERRRFVGHRGTVTSLAWSADGKTLVSGSADSTVLVWEASQ
jgi:WD40 repeat protein